MGSKSFQSGRRKFLKVSAGVVAGVGLGFSGAIFAKYCVRLMNAKKYLGSESLDALAKFIKEVEEKRPDLYYWLAEYSWLGQASSSRNDAHWSKIRDLNQLYFAQDRLRRVIGYQTEEGTPGVWKDVAFETYTVSLEKN